MASALLVGSDAGANFRIVPCKTDGTAVLKVNNGTEYKLSKAMAAGDWNALALVYAENDTEGTVAVYLASHLCDRRFQRREQVRTMSLTENLHTILRVLYDDMMAEGAVEG